MAKKEKYSAPAPGLLTAYKPGNAGGILGLRDLVQSKAFKDHPSPLSVALGKNAAGQEVVIALDKAPHLLIAGATGTGKSAGLNTIVASLLYKSGPSDVRLILADPKRIEFSAYKGLPHLLGGDIISNDWQVLNALRWLAGESERRQEILAKYRAKSFFDFNKSAAVKTGSEQKLPYIVLIIDEFADFNNNEFETGVARLAQKAHEVGIHLILATQRTSADTVTGTIKANLPGRIAYWVPSAADSRNILDCAGAESLSGVGYMLYMSHEMNEPKTVKGAFISAEEATAVAEYVKARNTPAFSEEFKKAVNTPDEPAGETEEETEDQGLDALMPQVLEGVIEQGSASVSFIQRKFALGYARAARIIDQMEARGFVGALGDTGARNVYITHERFKELFGGTEPAGTEETPIAAPESLPDPEADKKAESGKKAAADKKDSKKPAEDPVNAVIKVVGVGAGGINSVNRLVASNLKCAQFIAIDADAANLGRSDARVKIQIGGKTPQSKRAEDPGFDRSAALENKAAVADALKGADVVFITVGLGVGIGGGAALVVAETAKEMGILTIAFVTKPFVFEGKARTEAAEKDAAELTGAVDVLMAVPSEKLMELASDIPLGEAYKFADNVLSRAVTGIADLVAGPALIGFDFKDVSLVLSGQKMAHFGTGRGKGETRVSDAVNEAVGNTLLGTSAKGASSVILSVIGSRDMALREINEAAALLKEFAGKDANIILGADIRDNLNQEIIVTVIASGFGN